jgi:hypothetical protein
MLHKLHLDARMGPFKVPYADVKLCPTPDATATWQPVPHATMVETTIEKMAEAGFTVIDSAHALHGAEGSKYFGLFHVRTEEAQDDYGLVIGLTNSHDKTMAARLGIGAGMYATNTLFFSAEVRFGRKHTKEILRDLPDLVSTAVSKLDVFRLRQDKRLAHYKGKKVRDKAVHDLMIRAMDDGVVPGSKLSQVLREWREPSVFGHKSGGKTVARLHGAFSMALADCNVFTLPGRTIKLSNLLDGACGLQMAPVDADGNIVAEAPKAVAVKAAAEAPKVVVAA